jgi:NAD(P)H dehydrogenase (quinone)
LTPFNWSGFLVESDNNSNDIKMKVLIIYAHPESTIKGFSYFFLEESKKNLSQNNIDFEVLDLYKINYDPVLKLDELYTEGNKSVSEQNKKIQQKIKEAGGLIFIYPVWWGGMPAILKGFIDRVFTPGFAFEYKKEKILNFIPDKLLNDKKIVTFTNYGGPKFLYKFLLDPIKIVDKFIIFGLFCSRLKMYQLYRANKLDDKKMQQIKKIVGKGINWILY